jgi:hypothetical protein
MSCSLDFKNHVPVFDGKQVLFQNILLDKSVSKLRYPFFALNWYIAVPIIKISQQN